MARRYGYRILWAGVGGIGVGLGALSAAHWNDGPGSNSAAGVLRAAPLNVIGITAHYAASIPIPEPLRAPLYRSYCAWAGCDPNETAGHLTDFRSLADFFGRRLRPEVRPIDGNAALIVPCDGTVVDVGPVAAYGKITVKNVSYQIRDLLGASERDPLAISSVAVVDQKESGSRLWYTMIHISAGQCHRFSSPASWQLSERRHIPGHVLWLNPDVEGLYTENERIAMIGNWEHGMLSMTAVGAAGRGSITLEVNSSEESFRPKLQLIRKSVASTLKYETVQTMLPGDPIGGFVLGSAIVLLFEAPEESFSFHVKPGDRVRLGQTLASFVDSPADRKNSDDSSMQQPRTRREFGARERFRRVW